MDLFGSNRTLGFEETTLGDARKALPICADERRFPYGVGGLVPISTMRKKGEKVVYAFPVGDAEDAPEGDAPCEAGAEDLYAALVEAVDLVNRMLDQAAELARYDFGFVGGIEVGVPEQGWGFTRVEVVAKDAHGQPSTSPLHLCIETVDDPGSPDSLSAVVEYGEDAVPLKLTLTEFGPDGDTCRVAVSVNEKTGKLSVAKVEHNLYRENRTRLLYKRGQPRYENTRPHGRGGDGRGWR